jgi:uncharacterized cupredoxin-like copper-binding protein
MITRSDVNLVACLAAITVSAIYSGVAAFGPDANWHIHTAFVAGVPGDPEKPARKVEITMRERDGEMRFFPAEIEVRQGEQIRFVVKNEGEFDREFVLDSFDRNANRRVAAEKNQVIDHDSPNAKLINPKKSARIDWRFTNTGTFQFACLKPGHDDAHGIVIVSNDRAWPSGDEVHGSKSAPGRTGGTMNMLPMR